jgi:heat shock protein 5
LKNQVNDEEGLGGKIDEDDKETVSFVASWMITWSK